jgi:succinate dehydrogenase flavin-adding protein (antitoxin of CptAB toxin-antitoxin module)
MQLERQEPLHMPIVVEPESGIPFPFDTQPEEILQWRDRAKAAVATIREIVELGGEVEVTQQDRQEARSAVADDKPVKITEKNAGQLVHLEAILSEYDRDLLNVSTRLRSFVTNKLLLETVDPDPKIRIKALELLGKITNVGLFSERIDINVTHRTIEQVDQELDQILEKYLGDVDEVECETEEELNSLLAMSDEELGITDVEVKEDNGTESEETSPSKEA